MTARPKPPLTIVIKLGTSSIVSPGYPFLPHLQLLSSIIETVVRLRELGHRVVLVSSGAIGVGLRRMGLKERGKGLSHKQALAAIGQGRLIALYDNLFSQLDQPIAQVLLTRMDISDRTRYLNAQNTFSELLQMGVVPIVNENDTVSVSEIQFGDNDTLSAITSAIVHADYLFLLTDVRCLYTDNPRHNPDAEAVRVVRDIQKIRSQGEYNFLPDITADQPEVSTSTLGSSLGTGGMSTKLIAAELATAAGVTAVVMHAAHVSDIFGVIETQPGHEDGPLCTTFLKREDPIKDRKWWIAHGLHAAGIIVIDAGALRAITRKESGGRLLPAGVVRVEGVFASHQAVRLVVRRRRKIVERTLKSASSARSSSNETSPDPSSPSLAGAQILHPIPRNRPIDLLSGAMTDIIIQPDTPNLKPVMSLSSSIASLDPLSRSVPPSPALHAITERLAANNISASPLAQELKTVPEAQVLRDRGEADGDEWEEAEIGKGLAQYNSVEIDRIKGMKSSHIEQVLGYSESEHVVDSITFF